MPAPIVTAESLLARMAEAAGPDAAVTVFEGGFHALPAYESAALFDTAAGLYAARGRDDAARLLRGLARQMAQAAPHPPLGPDAEAVLAHPRPSTGLLRRLEQLDAEQAAAPAAALFEAVLAHVRPIEEYWVHFRMSAVYAALERPDPAFLLAGIALQFEPLSPDSLRPARLVAERLVRIGAWADAARLLAEWEAAHPDLWLLERAPRALVAAHAAADRDPPHTPVRCHRVLIGAQTRPAVAIAVAGRGLPAALASLLQPAIRPAITLAELDDAEVLIARGSVSVWDAGGAPRPDLSVGSPPSLVRRSLEARRRAGEIVDDRALERAVLIGDAFPAPNLCHFLLDQATRLALYAQAGIDLDAAVVIGPDLARPYQREIARRLGARRYLGTDGLGRVRVRRLWVLSNCHHLRHTAHLGAAWALAAIRAGFADVTSTPQAGRRLFVSRADVATRRVVNEGAALDLLRPHGFERIVPGEMTLSDQVRAFAAATHVVAPHGAALALIAFCAPGTRVLEMFHPHYGTYAYAMLVPALRLDYAAMTGFDGHSDDPADNDPTEAARRADSPLERDIRVDLEGLAAWLGSAAANQKQV